MTTQVPALTWRPYQPSGAQGTLFSFVNLDSTVDTSFSVPITGIYSNQQVTADNVVVFNDQNNGVVNLTVGNLQFPVNAFSRDGLQLPRDSQLELGVGFTMGTIQLQFYRGQPPMNPTLINQAGANSVIPTGPVAYRLYASIAAGVITINAQSGGMTANYTAAGVYDMTFPPLSNAFFDAQFMPRTAVQVWYGESNIVPRTAGSCRVYVINAAGVPVDPTNFSFSVTDIA